MDKIQLLIVIADLIGVGVFAISGALAAGRKSLDLLGVLIVSVVTAVGGGTLRDLLLGRSPVFWMVDPSYLYVIFAAAGFTLIYSRYRKPPLQTLLIVDAFGLALFAIMGANIAENAGVPFITVIILGTMTGVAGGIFRDIITNEIPLILRRDFYATAAIAGIIIYLLAKQTGLGELSASALGFLITAGLRLAAIFKGLRLPVFQLPDEPS